MVRHEIHIFLAKPGHPVSGKGFSQKLACLRANTIQECYWFPAVFPVGTEQFYAVFFFTQFEQSLLTAIQAVLEVQDISGIQKVGCGIELCQCQCAVALMVREDPRL